MAARSITGVEHRDERNPTGFATSGSFILLLGFGLVVFVFLPGWPFSVDQYDLPKGVALGLLGAASGLQVLIIGQPTPEHRADLALLAFLVWGVVAVPYLGLNYAEGWRILGVFAAAVAAFLLARFIGSSGFGVQAYWGVVSILIVMCALVLLEAYGGIPPFYQHPDGDRVPRSEIGTLLHG